MQALTSDDVQHTLSGLDATLQIRLFEQSTATSQMAADVIGCALGQIAKSLCLIVAGQPVLVVASGDQRLDDRRIATVLTVPRKQIHMASAEECLSIWGFLPGAVPPVGHRTRMTHTFLDNTLRRYDTLYAAGGSANAIFPITLRQLETITQGIWLDTARENLPVISSED